VLLYNNRYKNDNTTEWKLKFWWLDSYKIVKTYLKKNNYNIVKLNSTKKSETILKLKLKLYFLRHNITSHDYQQKINAFTSLINHWSHIIKDNTEYTDFNNSWHFLCRLLFTETQIFFEKKDEICCHYFVKSLNSEFIIIFLLLFMNYIITASQTTSFYILNHFSAFCIFQINNTDINASHYFFYILLWSKI